MLLVTHPTGNANVAAVVEGLHEAGLLAAYGTTVHWRDDALLARLLPASLRATLRRRSRVHLTGRLVQTHPGRELLRHLLPRLHLSRLTQGNDAPFSVDGIYRDMDRHAAHLLQSMVRSGSAPNAVYAYEDGALALFRVAERLGVRRLYDLPIGYWRAMHRIAREECELEPEWAGTFQTSKDGAAKLARKDEELALAETIFVPSTFVKETLAEYPGTLAPVIVNSFGVPVNIASPCAVTRNEKPLRVLFVGSLGQRKGISYLFRAVEQAGTAVTLTVIGRKVGTSDALDRACARHRWIPSLPHSEILREMREHDVFVFPSLFEGQALVTGEALSQGLPVITTSHSGATDILRAGIDSYIVPIRNADRITEHLLTLAADRERLQQMSDAALVTAQTLTWKGYQQRLLISLQAMMLA